MNCSFSPLQPGNYQVDILIENEVLSGSPFSFKVYEDDATISEGGTGFPENIKYFSFFFSFLSFFGYFYILIENELFSAQHFLVFFFFFFTFFFFLQE